MEERWEGGGYVLQRCIAAEARGRLWRHFGSGGLSSVVAATR